MDTGKMMRSFWDSDRVWRETCTMIEEHGQCEAKLLFLPDPEDIVVESYDGLQVWEKDRDYVIDGDVIRLTADSRIPYTTWDYFFLDSREEAMQELQQIGRDLGFGPVATTDGRFITLQAIDHPEHITQYTICVSYKKASQECHTMIPGMERLADRMAGTLPRFWQKLRNGQDVEIVLYGDSISYGYDCSGIYDLKPCQPIWIELVCAMLQETFHNQVTYHNISVPGAGTEWAAAHAAENMSKEWDPDLVILGYGMNDRCRGAEYKTWTEQLISETKKRYSNAEILLIATTLPNALTHTPPIYFSAYQNEFPAVLDTLAEDGIAVAEVQAVQEAVMHRKRYVDLTGNFLNHPNDFLARIQAQVIVDCLRGRR